MLTSGQGWARDTTTPIDTREEIINNSLVMFERGQNIVGKHTGRRSAPTTVNSSVRTREYLTTAEIETLLERLAIPRSSLRVLKVERLCEALVHAQQSLDGIGADLRSLTTTPSVSTRDQAD